MYYTELDVLMFDLSTLNLLLKSTKLDHTSTGVMMEKCSSAPDPCLMLIAAAQLLLVKTTFKCWGYLIFYFDYIFKI